MNHMKEVAHMLGVELEEEFELKERHGLYKINKNGLFRILGNEFKRDDEARLILNLILNGHYTVKKKSERILDDKEKEYLSNVIKPFRHKVYGIKKCECNDDHTQYIEVYYEDTDGIIYSLQFPRFDEGDMYKDMELGMRYTLGELGL